MSSTLEDDRPLTVDDYQERNAEDRYKWLELTLQLKAARVAEDADDVRRLTNMRGYVASDFIMRNRGLIWAIVNKWARAGDQNTREVYQRAAEEGLWDAFAGTQPHLTEDIDIVDGKPVAAGGWDPAKSQFAAFSKSHIRGRVSRAVSTHEHGMKYSEFEHRGRAIDAREALRKAGHQGTFEEIANKLGIAVDLVETVLRPTAASLDSPLSEDGGTLGDLVLAEQAYSHSDGQIDQELQDIAVRLSANKMRTTDLLSMVLRRGMIGRPELTVVETAARLGIGRGIVSAGDRRGWDRVVLTTKEMPYMLAVWMMALARPAEFRSLFRTGALT